MKTTQQKVTVRKAANAAEREAAFRIRYEVYVEEMGWDSKYANHDRRMIEQPLDATGEIWIALLNGKIIGTIRINVGRSEDLGFYREVYSLDSLPASHGAIGVLTNFVMLPAYRNLGIAMQLGRTAFSMAVHKGMRIAFLDCEHRMVRFYAWMGFEIYKADFVHPHYGPGVCMKMDVENWTDPAIAA